MSIALTIQNIFRYSSTNTDRYFVTLAGGASGVGLYTRSLKLLKMPLNQIVRSISAVLYVDFSKKQNEIKYLTRVFCITTFILAMLFIPVSAIVIIYAEIIVSIVYGDNWLAMVPLVKVLVIGAVISSLSIIIGDLLKSQGIVYKELLSNITSLLTLVVLSSTLYPVYGVTGIAISYVLSQLIFIIIQLNFLIKIVQLTTIEYLRLYIIPILLTVLVYATNSILCMYYTQIISFIIIVLFNLLVLSGAYWLNKQDMRLIKLIISKNLL